MNAEELSMWQKIHNKAVVCDLHAHPSLKLSLFKRILTLNHRAGKQFDPFSVRTDLPKLQAGGVSILNSVIAVPEQGLLEDCRPLRLLKGILATSKDVFSENYFQITIDMMTKVEEAIDESRDPETGGEIARVVRSIVELDKLFMDGEDRPIAVIHCVEGAHSLEGKIENLEMLHKRGVAYLTLAHFYPNEAAPPVFPFPEYIQRFGLEADGIWQKGLVLSAKR